MTTTKFYRNADNATDALDAIINDLNALVEKPQDSSITNLRHSWEFLQVYSTWGLLLPKTEETIVLKLGIKEPGRYTFLSSMAMAYTTVYAACHDFKSKILGKVIEVGNSLLNYSNLAGGEEGIFQLIYEILDINDINTLDKEELEAMIEEIQDLQKTAQENKEKAVKVVTDLNEFKANLETGQGEITTVQDEIDKEGEASQEVIDTITGGKDVDGSLKQLEAMIEKLEADYKHAVIVASTTPLYFLIPFPFGPAAALIAGGTVAGIFGAEAVALLKEIDKKKAEIKTSSLKLHIALETKAIQESAKASTSSTKHYTDLAIVHTNTVQNAWDGINNNLIVISDNLNKLLTSNDNEVKLKALRWLKFYAKKATGAWEKIKTPLTDLTTNPYIVVEDGEKTLGEYATIIETAIGEQR